MNAEHTPGSPEERQAFAELQARLEPLFGRIMPDRLAPRTVVVVPSLSFDRRELAKIQGISHYEERLLCMLMLLRLPRTRVIYVTSERISAYTIDYYLHLLAGIPSSHARSRLEVFACEDFSPRPLTQKILERPRLLNRIRRAIRETDDAHLVCFNTTELEMTLAVKLGIPLYGSDPDHLHVGTKSGSRAVFRDAGVDMPEGFENLRDGGDVVAALAELKRKSPDLKRAVVKLNDGFSGEGNAVFRFEGAPTGAALSTWIAQNMEAALTFEAKQENWEAFETKFRDMQGVVETFVEGDPKRSPSAQCLISPAGKPVVVSTHDQVLGGPSGQVFLGCSFPAADPYRMQVHQAGERIAQVVADRGVMGRFAVDFVSVKDENDAWKHYAIEINLRKGGTTHPFLMLEFLTDGAYDEATGLFRIPTGEPRYYYASDNLKSSLYKGLLPEDLIDIMVCSGLHFHHGWCQGVAFHLIGALSQYGKCGVVCIGESPEHARGLFDRTVDVLEQHVGPIPLDQTMY